MFPVTQDRRRKTVGSGCEDHGQQSRLFSRRSIPAAVPLLSPPDPAGCRNMFGIYPYTAVMDKQKPLPEAATGWRESASAAVFRKPSFSPGSKNCSKSNSYRKASIAVLLSVKQE